MHSAFWRHRTGFFTQLANVSGILSTGGTVQVRPIMATPSLSVEQPNGDFELEILLAKLSKTWTLMQSKDSSAVMAR